MIKPFPQAGPSKTSICSVSYSFKGPEARVHEAVRVQLRAEWEPGGHRHVPGRLSRHDRLQGIRAAFQTPLAGWPKFPPNNFDTNNKKISLSFQVAEDLIFSIIKKSPCSRLPHRKVILDEKFI
jgi:hypothetical protein